MKNERKVKRGWDGVEGDKKRNNKRKVKDIRKCKDWKEKDGRHVEWVKNWVETLNQLQDFVKQYHTTGQD